MESERQRLHQIADDLHTTAAAAVASVSVIGHQKPDRKQGTWNQRQQRKMNLKETHRWILHQNGGRPAAASIHAGQEVAEAQP